MPFCYDQCTILNLVTKHPFISVQLFPVSALILPLRAVFSFLHFLKFISFLLLLGFRYNSLFLGIFPLGVNLNTLLLWGNFF